MKKQLSETQNGPLPIQQLQNSETFGLKMLKSTEEYSKYNRASFFSFTFYLSAEAANTNSNMDRHHLMDQKSFSNLIRTKIKCSPFTQARTHIKPTSHKYNLIYKYLDRFSLSDG